MEKSGVGFRSPILPEYLQLAVGSNSPAAAGCSASIAFDSFPKYEHFLGHTRDGESAKANGCDYVTRLRKTC